MKLVQEFSDDLGREVQFEPMFPETSSTSLKPLIGPAFADIADLYGSLANAPGNVIASGTSAQRQLGLAPRNVGQ